MVSTKQNAPAGSQGFHPWDAQPMIDDGTMCRQPSSVMGPVFQSSKPPERHASNDDLETLFNSCLAPKIGITDQDYQNAADALGVEVEAIKTVAAVETKGASFDQFGRPTILFERHYFHNKTQGKFDQQAPGISNKKAGGYGKTAAQYGRLEQAFRLASDAALLSASWGRFQIMGTNFKAAGFSTVQDMVKAFTESEASHLKAFVSFVQHDGKMLKALKNKQWADFAQRYNGPNYSQNNYDKKMQAEYDKLQQQKQKEQTKAKSSPLP